MRVAKILVAAGVAVSLTFGDARPAGSAVSVWLTTATKQVGKAYSITGRVFALGSAYWECPRAQGDPEDGSATYCAYLSTEIQFQDPVAGWMPIASAKAMGPIPDNGTDGYGRFALTTLCPTTGFYRTYFAQRVSSAALDDWTDERWNSSTEFGCQLPSVSDPPATSAASGR